MTFTEEDYFNFQRKVERYKEVLRNTETYRQYWREYLKPALVEHLKKATALVQLACTVEERADICNLEAVVLSLGHSHSGLGEPIGNGLSRDLIKHNGALVYQQLFNGKIMVLINYPYIERYGQPQPPKTLAIYRPEELKEPYIIRHLETFIAEITFWEDYDDDRPDENQRIGFKLNFEQRQT
ncbi:MAG: hypothetical protein NZM43_11155 [Saprospiraceae bacterium]|nr:hypothetical protein [Saprospiraceae bacterium]MDW8484865.1 hypothetical protein [Saprospiraceae bacterium]